MPVRVSQKPDVQTSLNSLRIFPAAGAPSPANNNALRYTRIMRGKVGSEFESCAVKQPSSLWLQSITAHSVQMTLGRMRLTRPGEMT